MDRQRARFPILSEVDGRVWPKNEHEPKRTYVTEPAQSIDLRPHPRVLSVLGDIPFAPWQCIAELLDNCFDEFLRHPGEGERPRVSITLPGRNSHPTEAEVWITDNRPGLTLDQLQNALRAGWTSNDRHGHLGLFGMGFNIATARMGNITRVRTARAEDRRRRGGPGSGVQLARLTHARAVDHAGSSPPSRFHCCSGPSWSRSCSRIVAIRRPSGPSRRTGGKTVGCSSRGDTGMPFDGPSRITLR
jgi:hypothetical protein